MNRIIQLIISIAICQAAGIIGSAFTSSAIRGWYANLNKPSFNPPGWLFGPVWVTLYALMGIALYLIWSFNAVQDKQGLKKPALIIFVVHLGLNALWSIIFFGLHSPGWAMAEIIILWLFIVVLIMLFYSMDKRTSLLLMPYLLWVSFAAVLNYAIWRLN